MSAGPGPAVAVPGGEGGGDADAWVEVSPSTLDNWREQAWRGKLAAGREPGAGSSSDELGHGGPGTASMSSESLMERDASMSNCSSRGSGQSSRRSSAEMEDALASGALPVAAPAFDARAPAAGAPPPPGLEAPLVGPARRMSAPGPCCGADGRVFAQPRNADLAAVPPAVTSAAGPASAEEAAARGAALARLRARSVPLPPALGALRLAAGGSGGSGGPSTPPLPLLPSLLSFENAYRLVPQPAQGGDVGGPALLSVEVPEAPRRYSGDSDDMSPSPVRSFSVGAVDPNLFGRCPTAPGALSALLLRAAPGPGTPGRGDAAAAAVAAAASKAVAAREQAAAATAAAAAEVADSDAAELCCRLSRARQTVDFVHRQRARFCLLAKQRVSLWDALLALGDVPPVAAALACGAPRGPPVRHLAASVAAAEAALAAHPEAPWFAFVALTHALGRLLLLPRFGGEPAWAVVGETFPVGARFSSAVSYSAYFAANPDRRKRAYAAPHGVYVPAAGLAEVDMAWSGDEYLLEVLARNRAALPPEGLFCVRYGSFEALGQPGVSYNALMSAAERTHALPWLEALRRVKRTAAAASAAPDAPDGRERLMALEDTLRPLLERFCPGELRW